MGVRDTVLIWKSELGLFKKYCFVFNGNKITTYRFTILSFLCEHIPLNPCPWVNLKHPIIVSKSATQTDISCYLGAWWLWHPTSNTRTMLLWYLAQLDRLSLSNFSTIRLQCAISCATLLAPHEGRQIKREVGSEERCEFNFMVY